MVLLAGAAADANRADRLTVAGERDPTAKIITLPSLEALMP
jgi:hypothetical protein